MAWETAGGVRHNSDILCPIKIYSAAELRLLKHSWFIITFVQSMRQAIWTDRVNMISGHNEEQEAGVHSFRLGENHLADFTSEEIVSMMNGLSLDFDSTSDKTELREDELSSLPDSVDWRTKVRQS